MHDVTTRHGSRRLMFSRWSSPMFGWGIPGAMALAVLLWLSNTVTLATWGDASAPDAGDATLSSDEERAPLMVGYERFYRTADEPETQASAGAYLARELNCIACHAGDRRATSLAKQAPDLTHVGERIQTDYLVEYLRDPHAAKPGTSMPNVLDQVDIAEQPAVIEALVQFLATTGSLPQSAPRKSEIAQGEVLFHEVGCVACHQTRRDRVEKAADAVPLPELKLKYSLPSLTAFLIDPIHVRPSARMPDLNLSDIEARQIASYLLEGIEVDASLTYRYYEGNWDQLPNFDALQAIDAGEASSFDMNGWRRLDQFGVVFQGYFPVRSKGTFEFTIASDDGSRLIVDGEELLLVDGIHPVQTKSARLDLEQGIHEVVIEYFEGAGGQELYAYVQAPGKERQSLDQVLKATREQAEMPAEGIELDPKKVRLGADYFVDLGCAHCHDLKHDMNPGATVMATPLWGAQPDKGALADQRNDESRCPDFELDEKQRTDLRVWIDQLKQRHEASAESPQPVFASDERRIHETMLTFNCYACHQRGDLGGVARDREAWFVGTEPEMGDEGRIPPPLTGVGAKLDPNWLKTVMNEGAKDRPYMLTRMPRFGTDNVGHLVSAFADADPGIPPVDIDIEDSPRHVKVVGRFLTGRKGLSCIQCHTWGETRSTGVQAMSLTTMTRRLQKDWFQAYMLEPNQFRPGTRMPNSWPRGKSYFPEYFDGDVDAQVHAIWQYLSDGAEASTPEGLETPGILLTPEATPIIYRNFIEDAGTRAIGVGYPEGANLAFDANEQRPALMWQGAFIDASRHWQGRGQGWQPPAGENILRLVSGPAMARLEDVDQRWPSLDEVADQWQFLGYDLDKDRRPTFRYRFGDVEIHDFYLPVAGDLYPRFERVMRVSAESSSQVWLRLATAETITDEGDGRFRIDDWWLELPVDAEAQIKQREDGRHELRLPFDVDRDDVVLRMVYRW